jgi:hypothetical protein
MTRDRVNTKRLKHTVWYSLARQQLRCKYPTVMLCLGALLLWPSLSDGQVIDFATLQAEPDPNSMAAVSCGSWLAPTRQPTEQVQTTTPQEREDVRLEMLLMQLSLGQVTRQGATLHLRVGNQHFKLTDQCDQDRRVRYRLQDIRHLNLTWTIREETADHIRYLLMTPLASQPNGQQLVVNAPPVFSPNQQSFVVVDERPLDGVQQRTIRLYDWHATGWQRQYEQMRLHACRLCQPRQWVDSATQLTVEWQNDDRVVIHAPSRLGEPPHQSMADVWLQRTAPQAWQVMLPE